MILILIISIVLILAGVAFVGVALKTEEAIHVVPILFLTLIGSMLFIMSLWNIHEENTPQAIDVYRGNTVLRITYEDSIAIDTIVVFKNK